MVGSLKKTHNGGRLSRYRGLGRRRNSISAFRDNFDSKGKGGKRKISVMNKFDTKAVRALLVTESKFITELLDKRNFPVAGNNDSGKSSYFSVSLSVTFAIRKLLYLLCTVYSIYCMNVEAPIFH